MINPSFIEKIRIGPINRSPLIVTQKDYDLESPLTQYRSLPIGTGFLNFQEFAEGLVFFSMYWWMILLSSSRNMIYVSWSSLIILIPPSAWLHFVASVPVLAHGDEKAVKPGAERYRLLAHLGDEQLHFRCGFTTQPLVCQVDQCLCVDGQTDGDRCILRCFGAVIGFLPVISLGSDILFDADMVTAQFVRYPVGEIFDYVPESQFTDWAVLCISNAVDPADFGLQVIWLPFVHGAKSAFSHPAQVCDGWVLA